MGKYLLVAILGNLLTAAGQILLKMGASADVGRRWYRLYLNPFSMVSYGIFFLATVTSLIAFSRLQLKFAAVLQPLNLLFVGILSRQILGESVSRRQLMGAIIILAGIAIFNF